MDKVDPTRCNAISLSACLFDPLGIVSPVIVFSKCFTNICVQLRLDEISHGKTNSSRVGSHCV